MCKLQQRENDKGDVRGRTHFEVRKAIRSIRTEKDSKVQSYGVNFGDKSHHHKENVAQMVCRLSSRDMKLI
jgi:hypothetical protein